MGSRIHIDRVIPTFPINYFGSLLYYKELVKYDHVLFEINETFPKQTYRNRCDILSANGIISLTVPVNKPNGSKSTTSDILLDDSKRWRETHWRSIRSAYSSAPFFEHYGPEFEDLLFTEHETLVGLSVELSKLILELLEFPIKIELNSDFSIQNDFDVLCRKQTGKEFEKAPYIQVFPSEKSFYPAISILDALFCEGPLARKLLTSK